jgi:hypothetical protein
VTSGHIASCMVGFIYCVSWLQKELCASLLQKYCKASITLIKEYFLNFIKIIH